MTRSKPISMKKLYQWAAGFLAQGYEGIEGDYKHEEKRIILDFLNYVWEHRND